MSLNQLTLETVTGWHGTYSTRHCTLTLIFHVSPRTSPRVSLQIWIIIFSASFCLQLVRIIRYDSYACSYEIRAPITPNAWNYLFVRRCIISIYNICNIDKVVFLNLDKTSCNRCVPWANRRLLNTDNIWYPWRVRNICCETVVCWTYSTYRAQVFWTLNSFLQNLHILGHPISSCRFSSGYIC